MQEISTREHVRDIKVNKNEFYKLNISGCDGSLDRHITGYGEAIILDVRVKGLME